MLKGWSIWISEEDDRQCYQLSNFRGVGLQLPSLLQIAGPMEIINARKGWSNNNNNLIMIFPLMWLKQPLNLTSIQQTINNNLPRTAGQQWQQASDPYVHVVIVFKMSASRSHVDMLLKMAIYCQSRLTNDRQWRNNTSIIWIFDRLWKSRKKSKLLLLPTSVVCKVVSASIISWRNRLY